MSSFPDGSSIESSAGGTMFKGETAVNVFSLITAKSFLQMEIKYPGMKMSNKGSALNLAENLSGIKFGRGVKGREKALEWVLAELDRVNATRL